MDQALQDILWIAQRFRGVLDYLPELEKISTIEATIEARQQRLVELGKKEDEAKADVAKYLKDIEGLKATLVDRKTAIENDIAKMMADAKAKADHIVDIARKEHSLLNDSMMGMREKIAEMTEEKLGLQRVLDTLQRERAEEERRLLNLRSTLKNLKESI